MKVINVGVIGYGYWGPNLVRNFLEIPDSTVVAVADQSEESLERLRGRYSDIPATLDCRELLMAGLDAVAIATPPSTHFDLAREALNRGLHVLVEKPLTLTSREAEQLVQLAEERDRVLMVGHTFVYDPAIRALKSLIDREELGRVYYVDCVRANLGLFHCDSNVLWDLAPHDVSILLYLMGCDPIGVSAQGASCMQYGIEDVAYVSLVFPNYCLAHIRLSWLDPCKVRRITVVGSKKMVVWDDIQPLEKLRVYDKSVTCPPYTDGFGEFHFAYHYGDVTIPHIELAEPLRVQCCHFLECIQKHQRPDTDGINGLRVVEIIETAQKSLRNGGTREQVLYAIEPEFSAVAA